MHVSAAYIIKQDIYSLFHIPLGPGVVQCSRPPAGFDVDPNCIEKPAGASPEADDAGAVRRRHREQRPRRRSGVAVRPVRPAGAGAEGQRGDDDIGDASETPNCPLHCSDTLACRQLDLHICMQDRAPASNKLMRVLGSSVLVYQLVLPHGLVRDI